MAEAGLSGLMEAIMAIRADVGGLAGTLQAHVNKGKEQAGLTADFMAEYVRDRKAAEGFQEESRRRHERQEQAIAELTSTVRGLRTSMGGGDSRGPGAGGAGGGE